jgi:hypothetical protein
MLLQTGSLVRDGLRSSGVPYAVLEPAQAALLGQICTGPLISIADLEQSGVLPVPPPTRQPLLPDVEGTLTLL